MTRAIVLLLIGVSCVLAADPPKAAPKKFAMKGAPTTRTRLPEAHEYQRTLRAYLATLTEKDFTHGVTAPIASIATRTDPEYLYRQYVFTLMNQPFVGNKRGVPAITAPPGLFLLTSIETPQGVLQPPVWPETLIPFVHWDYPGNSYRDNRAIKLRAFVTATVLMTMLDDQFDAEPALGRGDWFGYQLVYFGLPYPGFKDVLPTPVQKAYEAGLRKMGQRMLDWGIRGEDTHNDLHAACGLFCVARAVNNPAFTQAVEAYARKLYTDPRYFNPAGYWTYRGGLDIPFNGHAHFFAAFTALETDLPFVKEALNRGYRLRGHLILREPDGKQTGPSHFNARVSGPASIDQWAWGSARDTAAAMVTDEAAHLITLPGEQALREAPAKRAHMFAADIRENPRDRAGRHVQDHEIISHPWKWRVWMTYNFPASVNPGYEFYPSGAYGRRRQLEAAKSPMLKSPFERGESFVRAFGKDFVVVRQPTFAAILHIGPIGTQEANDGMRQFVGPLGLSGGQLSAFWTPATGAVLLGQRGGMTNDKSLDLVEEWRTWPNHSVSGQTADGVFFTSARIQKPETAISIEGERATVRVGGTIPSAIVGQAKSIAGAYRYDRTFGIDDKGVTVSTTVSGDAKESIAELYETLPVYLRDTREQPTAKLPAIEFQVRGKWAPATDKFSDCVEMIRVTRFGGAATITFDRPRRAKLSPTAWADKFLSRGTGRNVLIDLLENDDRPTTIAKSRTVRYTLMAAK